MRVIGGTARGRRLRAPALAGLRPTSDRVREAIFDILEARRLVEQASFLDLFCGSGALGIEALSRGASSCTFVDEERRALAAVASNLAATGLGASAVELVASGAEAFCRRAGGRFSLALVDPPYGFERWADLLALLPAEVAVLEHSRPLEVAGRFQTLRSYRYGGTLVTLVAASSTAKDSP